MHQKLRDIKKNYLTVKTLKAFYWGEPSILKVDDVNWPP